MAKKLYGTDPDQVPTNADLGTMAYQDTNLFTMQQDTNGDFIVFRQGGTEVGVVSSSGSSLLVGEGSAGVKFNSGSTKIIPRGTNNQNVDGTIDLGGDGDRWKDLYLSGGVYLGGTGAANKLDDYEEGTWTPSFSGGNGTLTDRGWYIKVGNIVTCGFSNLTGITAIADSAKYTITGFPFNMRADAGTSNYKFAAGSSLVVSDQSDDSYSNKLHAARTTPTGSAADVQVHNIMGAATTTSDAFTLFATYVTA